MSSPVPAGGGPLFCYVITDGRRIATLFGDNPLPPQITRTNLNVTLCRAACIDQIGENQSRASRHSVNLHYVWPMHGIAWRVLHWLHRINVRILCRRFFYRRQIRPWRPRLGRLFGT